MESSHRIEILKQWGASINRKDWSAYYHDIQHSNPWFTIPDVEMALSGVCKYLESANLDKWVGAYELEYSINKVVGLILAGNIPLVGFHDFVCIIASGYQAKIKLSTLDQVLLPLLFEELLKLEPEFEKQIQFKEKIFPTEIEAIIATGSDNTSRYLQYHYRDVPRIIRKNRSSIGIIRGDENHHQLINLWADMFSYFGKGCRNVSKILVPKHYDFSELISKRQSFRNLLKHKKYRSNYNYRKALYSTEGIDFTDAGYYLLCQDPGIVSPLSVVFYDYYDDLVHLEQLVGLSKEKIQCISSAEGWFPQSYPFGDLQKPNLWDYSDGVDTMDFLIKLS
jgi:hypothetical protein